MTVSQMNANIAYPILVSKHIHERYSADAETALINNYLSDPVMFGDEYRAYQAYRAECKQRAKEELGMED